MNGWLALVLGVLLVSLLYRVKKTYDRSGADKEREIRTKLEALRKKRDE